MDFQNDPELEKLFKDELDERASSLADGARSLAAGDLTSELAGKMLREGHTIKGTGRVMGYEAIARGGETSELIWRWIQSGDLAPSSMLARTLEHLAQAIPRALDGGEHEISVAIDTVRALVVDDSLLDQLPEPLEALDDVVPDVADAVAAAPVGDDASEPADAAGAIVVEEEAADEVEDLSEDVAADTGPFQTPENVPVVEEAPAEVGPSDEVAPVETAEEPDDVDMDAVAATLDQIEREIEAAHTVDLTVETVPAGDPAGVADAVAAFEDTPTGDPGAVSDADAGESAVEAVDASAGDVAGVAAPEVDAEDDGPSSTAVPFEDADIPLVFEPGPDGKLPTPVITYEIVSSAFSDVRASEPAASGPPDGPPSLSVVEQPSVLDPESGAAYDLGGLLGAVETWATEESVPVNAGRLFRMINDVAALRIDLESAMGQAAHLLQTADGISAAAMEGSLELLETARRAAVDLEGAALGLTTTPLSGVTSTLPQLTKYLAKKVGRDIHLQVEGEATGVDRQLVDRIGEIIRQLVVNAVAHGIEPASEREALGKSAHGTVSVSLSRSEDHVQIVVKDDGSGIDWKTVREAASVAGLVGEDPTTEELRGVLYTSGFSTSPGVTEFTGDGEGLARVTEIVEQVFGTMSLESTPGRGTTFVVTLPAHRALQSAQIFSAGGRSWGLPASSVAHVEGLPAVAIEVNERGSFVRRGGEEVPYASFATVAGLDVEGLPSHVMFIQSPTGQIALAVDDVFELRQVATKDLSPLLSGGSVVSGVALLGGSETVMLVDAGRLAERMREIEIRPEGPVHSVLVVDDSQGVRQVVSGVLASHGFSTMAAGSVSDALAVLSKHSVDALVVDFSMPRADGVALIHMVRQRYGDIPIVMLSGVASDDDRARAERAGADAFFDKADFAKGALVEKLRELVSAEPVPADQGMAS